METEMRRLGYDKEEEYFYKLNKKLIEDLRKSRDQERVKQTAEAQHKDHWMKCPKCDADLEETDLLGIKIDQCTKCRGIFLDRGELEILSKAKEPAGFWGGLHRFLKG
jgi:uncharacterized protein